MYVDLHMQHALKGQWGHIAYDIDEDGGLMEAGNGAVTPQNVLGGSSSCYTTM